MPYSPLPSSLSFGDATTAAAVNLISGDIPEQYVVACTLHDLEHAHSGSSAWVEVARVHVDTVAGSDLYIELEVKSSSGAHSAQWRVNVEGDSGTDNAVLSSSTASTAFVVQTATQDITALGTNGDIQADDVDLVFEAQITTGQTATFRNLVIEVQP